MIYDEETSANELMERLFALKYNSFCKGSYKFYKFQNWMFILCAEAGFPGRSNDMIYSSENNILSENTDKLSRWKNREQKYLALNS